MKKTIQLSLLVALLLLGANTTNSQKIKTYSFDELEPMLHHQNDTIYVINFWGMWCKPCIEELPDFENIRIDFTGQKVKVILVSLDFGKNVKERLQEFLTINKINAETVLLDDPDSNNWIEKVDSKWDGTLPATLIYKKNQRKVYTRQISYSELARTIDKLNN